LAENRNWNIPNLAKHLRREGVSGWKMNIVTAEALFAYNAQDIDEIIISIEILRRRLADLVELKGKLDDSEILAASQDLDDALNEYYRWFEY
jgi:hypothetical protein